MNVAIDLLLKLESEGVTAQPDGKIIALKGQQAPPTKLLDSVKKHTPEIMETLERLHGIPLSELRERAGEDWPDMEQNPELLEDFAHAVMCTAMRLEGRVPPNYTATTVCAKCGPVFTFPGSYENVLGCPWCFNRVRGLPIPIAKRGS